MQNAPDQYDRRTEPRRATAVEAWQVELLPSGPYIAAYTPVVDIVGFAFDTQAGIHSFASDQRRAFQAQCNGLAAIPAGCEVYSESQKAANTCGSFRSE